MQATGWTSKQKIERRIEEVLAQVGSVGKAAVEHLDQSRDGMQLSFFQLDDPVLSQIRDEILGLDVNNLTPVEALNNLFDNKIKSVQELMKRFRF